MNTRQRFTAAALEVGAHITGTLFGSPFTGTVRSVRWHTRNRNVLCVMVRFDEPTLIGMTDDKEIRDGAQLNVLYNGHDAWNVSRGTDKETRIHGLA
jgi:hypothetical protein